MQFSQQLVSQWHCETSCWRIAQCNTGCLEIFLLREVLHEVELSSTFRNGLQQLTAPLHSVSPLQQLVSQFYGSFNKGACVHFLFFPVPRSIARQVAEKIAHCITGPQHQTSATCNATFSTIARQVAEKQGLLLLFLTNLCSLCLFLQHENVRNTVIQSSKIFPREHVSPQKPPEVCCSHAPPHEKPWLRTRYWPLYIVVFPSEVVETALSLT